MIYFKVHILVIIMYSENIQDLCFVNAEGHDIASKENSMLSGIAQTHDDSLRGDSNFVQIEPKTKKTRGTYKKRMTTTCKSIRNEETSLASTNSVNSKEQVAIDILTLKSIKTSGVNTITERLTSTTGTTMSHSDKTASFTTISTSIVHIFKLTKSIKMGSKISHFHKKVTTTKKPLDRRRQVIVGGRVEEPRHQEQPKRFTAKNAPIIHHKAKSFSFKNFTPKYSPIKFQSIFQQVIDLRKVQTNPNMARPNFTKRTTTNKYEANLLDKLVEYDEVLKQERKYNESRKVALKRELEEIQLREASMQKSYLFKFIVTKVTTESWEKDLPKSSRAVDEEFLDHYEARLNNEPIMRKHFYIRKCRAQKKIEQARQRLYEYRNGTLTKHTTRGKGDKSSDVEDEDDDDLDHREESSEIRGKKKHFDKRKHHGKSDRDESDDKYAARHVIQHPSKGHHTKGNPKKSTHFQPNDHYRQMQEGWAQRDLAKVEDNGDKRKEDATDIYEPDPKSSDEVERMKSYDITSNEQFIQYLKDNKFAQDERVLEAIHWVDRDRFAKDGYVDSPHNFGTNSIVERPSYQALCLDHLADKLVPGANVLDLGFGSGFMSCCMARMVGDAGHVTAVEHIQHLINLLLTKLKISYPKLYKLYRVMDVVDWDARKPYKKNGPYDVIHFGGGVKYIPLEFIPDLKINGSILVPVGPSYGPHVLKKITLIKKNVYTIQNLAEVEALHFCGPDEQVYEFRQNFGHHFIKLFSLFYKTVRPFNSTVMSQLQTYKLPDT